MYIIFGDKKSILTPRFAQRTFDKDAITDEDELVSACVGLVTVDRESQIIRLVHHTARVYFRIHQIIPNIQTDITKICITYLDFDDFRSDQFTHGEDRIVISDDLRSKYPFLEYAGRYWGYHARGPPENVVEGMVLQFLRRNLREALACDLINDTFGCWDFGPMPILTIFVHLGLEHLVGRLGYLDGGNSGVTCAIRYRNDEIVFLLVRHDAYWHDRGKNGVAAACSSHRLEGNENMVSLLAEKGLAIDLGVDNGSFLFLITSLRCKSGEGPSPMFKLLVKLGVKRDPQIGSLYTFLMRAVIEGDKFIVQTLLDAGHAVTRKNELGRDALIYAALAKDDAVVRLLLSAGADIDSSDRNGMTALCAACKGRNKEVVKLLLKNGADISAQDKFGQTAISIATENRDERLLKLLRDHGTDDLSEDELSEDETGINSKAPVDKAQLEAQFKAGFYELYDILDSLGDLNSSDNKFVAVIKKRAMKRGIDKTLSPFVDAYIEEKDREKDPSFVEEQETDSSETDVVVRRVNRAMRVAKPEMDRRREQHVLKRLECFLQLKPFC